MSGYSDRCTRCDRQFHRDLNPCWIDDGYSLDDVSQRLYGVCRDCAAASGNTAAIAHQLTAGVVLSAKVDHVMESSFSYTMYQCIPEGERPTAFSPCLNPAAFDINLNAAKWRGWKRFTFYTGSMIVASIHFADEPATPAKEQ